MLTTSWYARHKCVVPRDATVEFFGFLMGTYPERTLSKFELEIAWAAWVEGKVFAVRSIRQTILVELNHLDAARTQSESAVCPRCMGAKRIASDTYSDSCTYGEPSDVCPGCGGTGEVPDKDETQKGTKNVTS